MRTPIVVNRRLAIPLHRQIYDAWRTGILDGRFARGDRMPSSRELAAALRVSRATVAAAYDQLIAEGYLDAQHGSGTFVCRDLPDTEVLAAGMARAQRAFAAPARVSAFAARLAPIVSRLPATPRTLNLSTDGPTFDQFPFAVWKRLVRRHLQALGPSLFQYAAAWGRPPGAARHDRRVSEPLARGALRRKPGGHRERIAAGAGPVRTRAGRPGRRRRGGEPGLPRCARALRGRRGACAPGSGRRRRPGRGRPAGVRAPRLRHAVAPVPVRGVDVAGAPARAAGLGAHPRRDRRRRRLRQRIPLQRRAAAGAAGTQGRRRWSTWAPFRT